MKFVLLVIMYTMNPSDPPQVMHIAFNSSAECENAKRIALNRNLPEGLGGGTICVSESDLLNVRRR